MSAKPRNLQSLEGSAAEAVACKSAAARFAVPAIPACQTQIRHTCHTGHTFWQRRGCHTCMVIPFIPFLLPHENAYGENMQKHTVKPPLLLPNGGFTRPPEVYSLLPPCPPGATRASPKRTPKRMEKQGEKKEGQREAKGRPKDAKRGSKMRPGGSLGRVLGKIMQKSQVL